VLLVTVIAAARLVLHPAIEHLFGLEGEASAIVRRGCILVAAVLGYWAFVRCYERRGAEELTLRWRAAALGALAGASSIGITLLMLYGTGLYRLVAVRGFGAAASGVATAILVAAVLEEILFRGLLFRVVEERFGTWSALAVVSVLFGAVHLANPGSGSLTGLSVTLLGLMWTGVFIWSRNLWAVVAHHAAWNLAIFATGLPLSGSEDWRAAAPFESESRGHELWTGGAFGPEDSILSILVSSVCIVGILWLAKRNGRWQKAAPPHR
jgi:hypothetical protein